jgi:hypothetical protein
MDELAEENFDILFTKFARYEVQMSGDRHAEWVLFRHGSLYFQTMPDNIETSEDELIRKAKESLSEVEIIPGTSYVDTLIFSSDYENNTFYYGVIETFHGLIMIHPSKQISDRNDVMTVIHTRMNVLNDQQNPVVIATGNTKQN